MARHPASRPWSLPTHRTWPPHFRAVVRALLLCAHRPPPPVPSSGASLWALPAPVLQRVAAALAGRRTDWLTLTAGGGRQDQGMHLPLLFEEALLHAATMLGQGMAQLGGPPPGGAPPSPGPGQPPPEEQEGGEQQEQQEQQRQE